MSRPRPENQGDTWKLCNSTLDDFGGQIAKVYATVPEEGVKQIDFLSGIVGLDTDVIRKRASQLTLVDGTMIQLLHPLDVLESRLRNLDSLPSKRNAIGVAQARLAVSVVRAFIGQFMDASGDPRTVRQAIKRVEKLALDTRLSTVAFTYELDVLAAVPVERVAYPRFHERQWPKTLERLERKRERFIASQARRVALNAKRKSRES